MRLTKKTKLTSIIALQAIFIILLAVSFNAFSKAHINNLGAIGAINHAPPYTALNATAADAQSLFKDPATIVSTQPGVAGAERVVTTSDGNAYLFYTTVPASLASSPNQEVHEVGGVPTTVIRITQADLARITATEDEKAFPYDDAEKTAGILDALPTGKASQLRTDLTWLQSELLAHRASPEKLNQALPSMRNSIVADSIAQIDPINQKPAYVALVKADTWYLPVIIGLLPNELEQQTEISFVPISNDLPVVIAARLPQTAEQKLLSLPATSPLAIAWQPIIQAIKARSATETPIAQKTLPVVSIGSFDLLNPQQIKANSELDAILNKDVQAMAEILANTNMPPATRVQLVSAYLSDKRTDILPGTAFAAKSETGENIFFTVVKYSAEEGDEDFAICLITEEAGGVNFANISVVNDIIEGESFMKALASAETVNVYLWAECTEVQRALGITGVNMLEETVAKIATYRSLPTSEQEKPFPLEAVEQVSLSDSTASLSVYRWINLFYSQQGGIESAASLKIQEASKILARVEKASLYDTKIQDALANPEIGNEIKALLITPIVEKGSTVGEAPVTTLVYLNKVVMLFAEKGAAVNELAQALARVKNNIAAEEPVSADLIAATEASLTQRLAEIIKGGKIMLLNFENALAGAEALQYRTAREGEPMPIMRPFAGVTGANKTIGLMTLPETQFGEVREAAARELVTALLKFMLTDYAASESIALPEQDVNKFLASAPGAVENLTVDMPSVREVLAVQGESFIVDVDGKVAITMGEPIAATAGTKPFPMEANLSISSLIQTSSANLAPDIKVHADNASTSLQTFDTMLEEAAFSVAPEAAPAKLNESLVALGNARQNLTDLGQNMPQEIQTNALPAVKATYDLTEQTIGFGKTLLERANAAKTTEAMEAIAQIKTPVTVAYGPGLFENQLVSMNFGTHKKTCNFNAVTQDDFNNDGVALVYYKGDINDVLANPAINKNQKRIVFVRITDEAAQELQDTVYPIPHMNIAGIYTALYVKAGYHNPVVKSMIDGTLSLIMGIPVDIDALLSSPDAAAAFIIKTIKPLYTNYTGDVGELQRRLYLALIAA